MLNPQLIDIINSGEAWAMVGSGCSADAGLPLWDELLAITQNKAAELRGTLPLAESRALDAHLSSGGLPEAFSVLKEFYGGELIDNIVTEVYAKVNVPGETTKLISRWPFAAYITTNYDHLLEDALKGQGGWVAVGNTADENRKISGNVRSVVWHPHGGARLGAKNLRLVIAGSDYDEIYSAGSPTLSAMEALFRMRSLVLLGFGFRDPDLVKAIERVGRLITPSRPAFAFLANCRQKMRDELWSKYKIEVISYSAKGHDHSELHAVLSAYGLFILDRQINFTNQSGTPAYDTTTVGLLTHNRLVHGGWSVEGDALSCVARSFVLAQLSVRGPLSVDDLVALLGHQSHTEDAVRKVVSEFIVKGIVTDLSSKLTLLPEGADLAVGGKAAFELVRDQFHSSITARLEARPVVLTQEQVLNAQGVAVRYIERACKERGLGVAQQLSNAGNVENRARAVALLQGAKVELSGASDRGAALAAIHCIWEVFTSPRPEERRYLGLMTQAYFGRHLLSLDPAAARAQLQNLQATAFVADSNFLIPLLAEGSVGHLYASRLAELLNRAGCRIVTSDLLLEECVEHARWAWKLLAENGSISSIALDAARGARGYRPNAFLTGYLNDPRYGPGVFFKKYFAEVLSSGGDIPDVDTVAQALRHRQIIVQGLTGWNGFDPQLWGDVEHIIEAIEDRRRRNRTYKHERQVRAEAEVARIITGVRRRELKLEGRDTLDAYFLSHSRVVDNLPGQAHWISLTPESLHEWLTSINEVTDVDADAVFDQLVWELNREGIDVVPRMHLLRLFHNIIDAAEARLKEVLSEHREIIRQRYAQDPELAFQDVDPLNAPSSAEAVTREVLQRMQEAIAEEQRKRTTAEALARSAVKDAAEYARLKEEKRQRQKKANIRKQRAKSSTRKGPKKKK